ncbi:MAG TPA: MBL fold metallo-hydrolase [Desulfobacterales bacterium]|nr:MBL fold metallo-hydrolase [Desulfobacterales bacterium]
MESAIDVYVSRETKEALNLSGHRLHIIEPEKQFEIGTWTIDTFPLVHDVPNIGFLLSSGDERLLYATDTHYIAATGFEGLTHIMIEINFSMEIVEANIKAPPEAPNHLKLSAAKRIMVNHMHLKTAIDFLKANDLSRVQEIHLLHLSDNNSIAKIFKSAIQSNFGKPTYISEV